MSFPTSGWGSGKWGTSLIWGYASTGIMAAASRVTAEMIRVLEQSQASLVQIGARLEIDGTDVTSYASAFRVTLRGVGIGASDAEFELTTSSLTINLHQSVVALFIDYTAPSGATFTSERFRGLAHAIEETRSATGSTWKLTCLDQSYMLAERAIALAWQFDFIGSAEDKLNEELAAQGFGPIFGKMADWDGINDIVIAAGITIIYGGFPTWPFANSRDFINILASYRKPSLLFTGADNITRIKAYDESAAGPFSFPLACQTQQQPSENATERCNHICIQAAGAAYNFYTTQDDADITAKGLMRRTITKASASSWWPIRAAIATDYMSWSQLCKYRWRSNLHAFVFPTDVVTLTLTTGGTKAVMVEEVTDSGGFPDGYWSEWIAREVP